MRRQLAILSSVDPLLVLRALACLLVVGSHIQRAELHASELQMGMNWSTMIDGHFGVWIYFLLSGYLIGKGYLSGRYRFSVSGVTDFYTRRLTKVYVPYVLTAVAVFIAFQLNLFEQAGKLIDVILLRGDRVYNYDQISYLWTVSNIIQWYLIAPFVSLLVLPLRGKKTSTYLLGIAILGYGMLMRWMYLTGNPVTSYPTYNVAVYIRFIANIDFFLFGLWINLLLAVRKQEGKSPSSLLSKIVSVVSVTAALAFATYYLAGVYEWQEWSYAPYALFATTLTTLSVGMFIYTWEREQYDRRQSIVPLSIVSPVLWIGMSSYGIYLMQTPLVKLLELECKDPVSCSLFTVFYRSTLVVVISLIFLRLIGMLWENRYVYKKNSL